MEHKDMADAISKLQEWREGHKAQFKRLEERVGEHSERQHLFDIKLSMVLAKVDASKYWMAFMLAVLGLILKFWK